MMAKVQLDENTKKALDMVKAKYGLEDTADAIKYVVSEHVKREPELERLVDEDVEYNAVLCLHGEERVLGLWRRLFEKAELGYSQLLMVDGVVDFSHSFFQHEFRQRFGVYLVPSEYARDSQNIEQLLAHINPSSKLVIFGDEPVLLGSKKVEVYQLVDLKRLEDSNYAFRVREFLELVGNDDLLNVLVVGREGRSLKRRLDKRGFRRRPLPGVFHRGLSGALRLVKQRVVNIVYLPSSMRHEIDAIKDESLLMDSWVFLYTKNSAVFDVSELYEN